MDQNNRHVVRTLETLRVLILDDDPFMCDVLRETLNQLNITRVIVQEEASIALDFILAQEPENAIDVLLCDLHMPGMDGIEFITALSDHTRDLGLVIVSGADNLIIRMANILADAHGVQVLGVLKKPVARKDLCAVLEKALV